MITSLTLFLYRLLASAKLATIVSALLAGETVLTGVLFGERGGFLAGDKYFPLYTGHGLKCSL